ncbi:hypothetical protein ACFQV8_19330 [Pseudonocardia benzenivorans]
MTAQRLPRLDTDTNGRVVRDPGTARDLPAAGRHSSRPTRVAAGWRA